MAKRRRQKAEREGRTAPPEAARSEPAPSAPRPSRRRLAALAAALVLLAGAAGGLAWWRRAHPAALRRDPGLSVLLITIDTLRADAVTAYGGPPGATPWIDRLAAGGVRFESAHAHNVVTLPSHVNILTGLYPLTHGVRDNSGFRVSKGTPTLASRLSAAGLRTGGFVSAYVLGAHFGMGTGFDVYDDRVAGGEWQRRFVIPERRGSDTVAEALKWRAKAGAARTFTFVHLYEPHFPYEPPEPFASRFAGDPYRGEVAAADAALEPLLRPLLEAGKASRTLVILTADHGEALGEHGEATHGLFAYESTLRVPLVVWSPGLVEPGVVRPPVRHVDIVPTVLDALGLPVPGDLPGRSLLPLLEGGRGPSSDSYFEALSASLNRHWAPLRGVRQGDLKYIALPIPELYDVGRDPGETHNLVASRPSDVDRLRARLDALRAGEQSLSRVVETKEAVERLRALGYVTGRADEAIKEHYTDADDPKRLVDIDAQLERMLTLFHQGDVDGAIEVGRAVLRRRPDTDLAQLQIAYLERARGNLGGAVEAARRAVALRPTDTEAASLLGVYLTEAGRPAEAVALLEPWTKADPPDIDVLTGLGMAQAELGRRDAALATLARARAAYPTNAMVLVNIGTVHLMAGDLGRAQQAFEGALDIDPRMGRAQNGLGVIAAREGRMGEAVERWKAAVALNPEDYRTLFNLGSVLWGEKRREEARPYLEAYLKAAPPALEGRDISRVRAILAAEGSAP